MHIKELEIDNFKSFASKVTIPLLGGFTTISGPNGSGKSNIIDSVLFALGLSTSRALRAEKLFHLISTYTKRNEAFVRVTFEKDDGEDLVIARRIKKSSQGFNSVYYMDEKTCSLTEIHTELEKYNITPNSYNVIMQGDVTSIINSSPNERRKIIDEIAGVADFDRRIEQAQKELEVVESRVDRSNIFLDNVEERLEQLGEERETALKYKKLRDEKTFLEGHVSAVKYFDTQKRLEAAHQSILEYNKKKKEQELTLEKLIEKLNEVNEQYKQISQEVKEKGEEKQIEIKTQAEGLKGEIQRKTDSFNYCEKQIHDNLRTIENSKNGIENAQNKKEEIKLKIEQKEQEIQRLEEEIALKNEEKEKILLEVSGLSQSADEHIKKRNELKSALDKVKDEEMELIKEKSPLEERLIALKKDFTAANVRVEEIEAAQKTFDEKKSLLQIQIDELSKEMEDFKLTQQNTFRDLDLAKNEANDSARNIQLAYRKLADLEAAKRVYQSDSRNSAVEAVVTSGMQGVHNTLASLTKVDRQYNDALEAAMGGRANFVVVDDEDVASRAIELLKTSNAGRATFLPMTKIAKSPSRLNLPKAKGVVDFAINLIDFDDIYIDAFYFALGETLVVEDMASAKPLMGRYRVVTLEGEIFEKSGSITGGSKRRSRIQFGKSEDAELSNYKKRLTELENSYKELENKKTIFEKKLDKIRVDYSNAMTELNKAKMELSNLIKNNEEAQEKIEKDLALINDLSPQIKKSEKRLDELEIKHIEINDKMLALQGEIEEVEKLMDEGELAKLKKLTEEVELKIKEAETKVLEIKHEINNENLNIKFQDNVIDSQNSTIAKLLKDNETLESDKVKFSIEIEGIERNLKELEKQIEELGEQLAELQEKRDTIHTLLLEHEKNKNILENDIGRTEEQVESFKARRRELEPILEEAKRELDEANIDIKTLETINFSMEEITAKIARLEKRMAELEPVNMLALTAYDEVLKHREELKTKIETLTQERKEILERMTGYETQKKEAFLTTYNSINTNFIDVFNKLSDGEGTLVLENEEDPVSGGLTIEASVRDKKKQRLESMSGGEKSLTALAFVFAIQKHLPAPFYAFDEVDMHLDTINVEKLANMIQTQAKQTQFIVVSLRKPMIESADRTIGVTQKEKGITRVTGVKLRD